MKKLTILTLLIALFACKDDTSEYIKIKDVYQGDLTEGKHEFTFKMIEAGDFQVQVKIGKSTLREDFTVSGLNNKADTTGNGSGTTPTTPSNKLTLDKTEYGIDQDIVAELELINDYTVEVGVYKKSE